MQITNPCGEIPLDNRDHRNRMLNPLTKLGLNPIPTMIFFGTGLMINNPSANTIFIDGAAYPPNSSTTVNIQGLPLATHTVRVEER